jgi:Skp family chaperone for outer membrane proteins
MEIYGVLYAQGENELANKLLDAVVDLEAEVKQADAALEIAWKSNAELKADNEKIQSLEEHIESLEAELAGEDW